MNNEEMVDVLTYGPITIASLNERFPRKGHNCATTGFIPMSYFEKYEKEIRTVCKNEIGSYRVIYRGSRHKYNATMTRREDATHAVIYLR